jgi:phage repressor protein C with HTH and peptisase S24 domain
MDKILAPIKGRIMQYVEFKGFEKKTFFEKHEISASNFRGPSLKSEVGGDVIAKISTSYPEINPEWLLTGKGSMLKGEERSIAVIPIDINRKTVDAIYEQQFIPLYSLEATAGLVELFRHPNDAEPMDQLYIPNLPKCDGAVFVSGDSMYPLLKSGDIVVFKKITDFINEVFYGEMYLLSMLIAGEEYVSVKFVQKSDKGEDYIKLVSQNQHHQSKDIHIKKVMAMALIKASIRINSMS